MNKRLWLTALAVILTTTTFARAKEPGKSADSPKPLRLAFITCCKDGAFFKPVIRGMNDAAKAMGVECTWMGTEGVDLKAQAALVHKAVADGYDGIAVSLIDPVAFDEVVAEAVKRGVPVVAFNVDDHATPNARLASVNQRLFDSGKTLGRYVAPRVPSGSHVLMTMHDEGVSALEDRLHGMQEVLGAKGVRWTVRVSGNDATKGTEVIAKALRENPDIKIVLCTGQADTEAAGRAIARDYPSQGRWAAGFDLSPTTLELIKQGHILATVDQQPYVQGFYPVVQLALYLRYGIVPTDMDAGAIIIDRASADRVLELTKQKYR